MSSDPILVAEGLSKHYLVYAHPQDRLKQSIMPRLAGLWNRAVGRPRVTSPVYCQEFWALRDVGIHIVRGETVGIIGTNGSGKSTLLQIVCGTLRPTTGRIAVHGRIAALLELGAGFDPEFTGRQNVELNAAIYGMSQEQIAARFDEIAAFADIGEFMDRPVKTYSSGMFVRLAFAVIAHVDADILVIDEALAVGDVFFTQKCMRFLREFKQRGTILFVSHDTSAVVNLCERALWLSEGRVRQLGPAKEVCEQYLASQYSRLQKVDLASAASDSSQASPSAKSGSVPIGAAQRADQVGRLPVRQDRQPSGEEARRIDQRLAYLNGSSLRNDIEVFRFGPVERGFGTGEATIKSVRLLDVEGQELGWIVGGEHVCFEILAQVHVPVRQAILGFFIKDRLGQVLFGENTYLTYETEPVAAAAGGTLRATFSFRMPILPAGDYAADVAIADGTAKDHVQLCWLHDGLTLKSHISSASIGLVGIVCDQVTLNA